MAVGGMEKEATSESTTLSNSTTIISFLVVVNTTRAILVGGPALLILYTTGLGQLCEVAKSVCHGENEAKPKNIRVFLPEKIFRLLACIVDRTSLTSETRVD